MKGGDENQVEGVLLTILLIFFLTFEKIILFYTISAVNHNPCPPHPPRIFKEGKKKGEKIKEEEKMF